MSVITTIENDYPKLKVASKIDWVMLFLYPGAGVLIYLPKQQDDDYLVKIGEFTITSIEFVYTNFDGEIILSNRG